MSDLQLLPCPFCGNEGEVIEDKIGQGCFPEWRVQCVNCNARSSPVGYFTMVKDKHGSKDDAIKAWNRRV